MKTCLSCTRTEQEIPLLVLQFRDEIVHICPQCLPVLIHKPEKLAEIIPGLEKIKHVKHEE